jgi:hypothetical protein
MGVSTVYTSVYQLTLFCTQSILEVLQSRIHILLYKNEYRLLKLVEITIRMGLR